MSEWGVVEWVTAAGIGLFLMFCAASIYAVYWVSKWQTKLPDLDIGEDGED